jgi:hypothetical protein
MTTAMHEGSGASFEALDGWVVRTDVVGESGIVAIEPEDDGAAYRASLVLIVEELGEITFADWQDLADASLPATLVDYQLLDAELVTVGGSPGGRRLAHYATDEGRSVTMEQWFTKADGRGYVLTATVDTLRYDLFADELSRAAGSLSFPGARR